MDLQLALIILGGFAIAGILVHGLWTIRKNSNKSADWGSVKKASDNPEQLDDENTPSRANQGYDSDGIGQVRVVPKELVEPDVEEPADEMPISEQSQSVRENPEPQVNPERFSQIDASEQQINVKPIVDTSKEPFQSVDKGEYPEPPASLLKPSSDMSEPAQKVEPVIQQSQFLDDTTDTQGRREPSFGEVDEQPKVVKAEKPLKRGRRKDPKLAEDQLRIDFEDEESPQTEGEANQPASAEEQEVLILNVKVAEGQKIPGSALLPLLLTLGFKFGDQDIFHRHVNSNGKGPILFSMANMFRPGVFDIDNMENFTTQGVSLFMVLPIEGDPRQVFNMMHNAARKISDEFGGQILDGRRSVLTKQGLQQYMEKIRESERRRMLRKSS